MESGELALALQIPPGFGRAIRRGETAEIAGLIDDTDTNHAGTVESYVKSAHADVLAKAGQSALAFADLTTPRSAAAAPPVQLIPRFQYNPAMKACLPLAPRSRLCCCCCFRQS